MTDAYSGKYEFYWVADVDTFGYVILSAERGNFKVDPDEVFMTPSEFGTEQVSPGVPQFYDTTMWYDSNDPEFSLFGYDEKCGFHIEDNKLHWKVDENGNGEYDYYEVIIYLRED